MRLSGWPGGSAASRRLPVPEQEEGGAVALPSVRPQQLKHLLVGAAAGVADLDGQVEVAEGRRQGARGTLQRFCGGGPRADAGSGLEAGHRLRQSRVCGFFQARGVEAAAQDLGCSGPVPLPARHHPPGGDRRQDPHPLRDRARGFCP
ncbi:hypothetical protein GCM10010284_26780 [Streptomyces rubiginosohelvolus]|uniref:Uncharacterized protein n=1 Tax=Streptomyces rubiginosohelvolus TaxID=67362 RepID=A0ABQ3C4U6_9ACTN|nr:hypothetical protein GCM10010284_26780 [Streptomyces rubiginosohelvolus]GGZ67207.1 hypothetical protein GCM10010328_47890 [Streptomyces pluricolorescens]